MHRTKCSLECVLDGTQHESATVAFIRPDVHFLCDNNRNRGGRIRRNQKKEANVEVPSTRTSPYDL